jgi:hypothetical protein
MMAGIPYDHGSGLVAHWLLKYQATARNSNPTADSQLNNNFLIS